MGGDGFIAYIWKPILSTTKQLAAKKNTAEFSCHLFWLKFCVLIIAQQNREHWRCISTAAVEASFQTTQDLLKHTRDRKLKPADHYNGSLQTIKKMKLIIPGGVWITINNYSLFTRTSLLIIYKLLNRNILIFHKNSRKVWSHTVKERKDPQFRDLQASVWGP